MRKAVSIALLLSALLSACSTLPTHPSLQEPLPPLVPVRSYVADWNGNGGYQISPDGQQLMWLARRNLGPGLFVKNLQTGAVRSFAIPVAGQWAEDSRHILLHMDSGGNEDSHVYQLDAFSDDAKVEDLTPFGGAKSFIHALVRGSPDLLISSNKRDAKVFDLYRYVKTAGKLDLLAQNPGDVAQWVADRQGNLRGRVRKDADQWVYEVPPDAGHTRWRGIFSFNSSDTFRLLEAPASKRFLWALSNRGRDKVALVEIDLETGDERVVFDDQRVDLTDAYVSARTLEPLAATVDPDFQTWKVFDRRFEAAIGQVQGAENKRIDVVSISRDENVMIAMVVDGDGGRYVLYDAAKNRFTLLGELSRSRIHSASPIPPQRAMAFQSRDGLPLHAYLTLPAGSSGKSLPTVLYVHGGPWARDFALENDPMPLFLANRGYAVLQVNFRGSSGYGRAFLEAGRGEFARKMQDDLIDGVDELIRQGIADPGKVAIMGGSYGGYASLAGMTFTPERFACGISMVGMSDLASLIENAPPYWELHKSWWIRYVGDPGNPEERAAMRARSPLYFADKVRAPLLIFHGANDPRVRLDQSTRMVDALRHAGKDVRFHVFQNAGHGTESWSDNLTFYRKTEDFLAQCLGGRSSGFDFFQLGSWAF